MNLTLHTQMERVNWDNWQIPWRNEMPRTAESNSSVCFLSGRKNHSVLMYCLFPPPAHRKTHSFLSGEFCPNLVGSNGRVKSGNWFLSVTCWHFIRRYQSKSPGTRGCVKYAEIGSIMRTAFGIFIMQMRYIRVPHKDTGELINSPPPPPLLLLC